LILFVFHLFFSCEKKRWSQKKSKGKSDKAKKENLRFLRKKAEVFSFVCCFFHKSASVWVFPCAPNPHKSRKLDLRLPRAGSGQPQADGWGALPKPDRFLPSIEKVKKLKEKPRERTAVIFFADLLGVLRKSPMTPRSFSFRFLFFFQKEKEESKQIFKTKTTAPRTARGCGFIQYYL